MNTQLIVKAPVHHVVTLWKWSLYVNDEKVGTLNANKDFVINIPCTPSEIYFVAFKGNCIRTSTRLKVANYHLLICDAILYMQDSTSVNQQYDGQFAELRIYDFLDNDNYTYDDEHITVEVSDEQVKNNEEIIIQTPQGKIAYRLNHNMDLNKTYRFKNKGHKGKGYGDYYGNLYVNFVISDTSKNKNLSDTSYTSTTANLYSEPVVICISGSDMIEQYISTLVYMDFVVDRLEPNSSFAEAYIKKNINMLYIIDLWKNTGGKSVVILETLNNDVTVQKIFFNSAMLLSITLKEHENYKKAHVSIYTCDTEQGKQYIMNREVTFSMDDKSIDKYMNIFNLRRMGMRNNEYNVTNLQEFVNINKHFAVK